MTPSFARFMLSSAKILSDIHLFIVGDRHASTDTIIVAVQDVLPMTRTFHPSCDCGLGDPLRGYVILDRDWTYIRDGGIEPVLENILGYALCVKGAVIFSTDVPRLCSSIGWVLAR